MKISELRKIIKEEISNLLSENNREIKPSTFMKLINTATRDGYLTGGQASAPYIMASAHKIADAFDALKPEEQKVFRDTYNKKFIDSIKK